MVIDASIALAAVLPDEVSAFARAAIAVAVREGLVVPALWPYEIQNGLAMALRRNRIDVESLSDALDALRGLGAELQAPQALGQELRLARTHELTAYDAAYLAVAVNTGATLATQRSAPATCRGSGRHQAVRRVAIQAGQAATQAPLSATADRYQPSSVAQSSGFSGCDSASVAACA